MKKIKRKNKKSPSLINGIQLGGPKFGFDRNVPPRNLKVDPYKYQFLKKKPIPIGPMILSKIVKFFLNFLKFVPILAQIFIIFLKRLIHIPNSVFYKGSFIYQRRLILLPMLAARPVGSLVSIPRVCLIFKWS